MWTIEVIMKKFALVSSLLAASSALFAAPVGNPAFSQLLQEGYFIPNHYWVDLRLGYEGDFVGDARMKQQEEGSGRVDNYRQDTNSGLVTVNFLDRLDVYTVLGSTRVCADWRFIEPGPLTNRVAMETSYHFSWAVGGRGILYEWGNTILGIGGRYNRTCLKPVWMTINGIPMPTAGTRLHWREWQVDLDISHKIDLFIPYIGIKYSNAHTKVGTFKMGAVPIAISNSGSGALHMTNRTPVGLVIGCALTTGKFFMLNIEGRLIDEEAATIVGDFRF
jgi:hypothetical protein